MTDGSPNQALFDGHVRRRIYLERYSRRQNKALLKLIKEVEEDLLMQMAKGATLRTARGVSNHRTRLQASLAELHADVYKRLRGLMNEDFRDLAKSQAIWEHTSLSSLGIDAQITQVTSAQAYAASTSRPMQGRLLSEWMKDLEPAHRKRLQAALRISFIEGENVRTARSRILAATGRNGRGLDAFIRTANTHVASAVSNEVYRQNPDIVKEYEWRSILDSRTSPICRARDSQVFEVGKGPVPPAHIGCRSTTTPILKGFPPPERETYSEWIGRQSAEAQDDILGPGRGRLLRAGKLRVDGFVDKKGKVLTLAELDAR